MTMSKSKLVPFPSKAAPATSPALSRLRICIGKDQYVVEWSATIRKLAPRQQAPVIPIACDPDNASEK